MTAAEIRKMFDEWYSAHRRHDFGFFERLLADDVEWSMNGPPQAFPAPTELRGKAAVMAAMRKISEALNVERNVLREVLVDGDKAAVIADRTVMQRATGRTLVYRVAAFLTFRDGKLVHYQSFYDSFDMLEQVIGTHLDVPETYQSEATESAR
jgi:ketosteroid isomerase-like protein